MQLFFLVHLVQVAAAYCSFGAGSRMQGFKAAATKDQILAAQPLRALVPSAALALRQRDGGEIMEDTERVATNSASSFMTRSSSASKPSPSLPPPPLSLPYSIPPCCGLSRRSARSARASAFKSSVGCPMRAVERIAPLSMYVYVRSGSKQVSTFPHYDKQAKPDAARETGAPGQRAPQVSEQRCEAHVVKSKGDTWPAHAHLIRAQQLGWLVWAQ